MTSPLLGTTLIAWHLDQAQASLSVSRCRCRVWPRPYRPLSVSPPPAHVSALPSSYVTPELWLCGCGLIASLDDDAQLLVEPLEVEVLGILQHEVAVDLERGGQAHHRARVHHLEVDGQLQRWRRAAPAQQGTNGDTRGQTGYAGVGSPSLREQRLLKGVYPYRVGPKREDCTRPSAREVAPARLSGGRGEGARTWSGM